MCGWASEERCVGGQVRRDVWAGRLFNIKRIHVQYIHMYVHAVH